MGLLFEQLPRQRTKCSIVPNRRENAPLAHFLILLTPQTRIQTYIINLVRHSVNFARYKVRKSVVAAHKAIYTAVDADAAEMALTEFEDSDLAKRYPAIASSWRRA